jgi:hypothetical protein
LVIKVGDITKYQRNSEFFGDLGKSMSEIIGCFECRLLIIAARVSNVNLLPIIRKE